MTSPEAPSLPDKTADHVAAFTERHRIDGAARPLLLIARGAPGLNWYYDARMGRWRLVDVYAENLPEAMIDWAGRNGRKVCILYNGPRPAFDAAHPSYADLYGDVVREVDFSEFRRGFRMPADVRAAFEDHYRRALLGSEAFRALFRIDGIDLFDSLPDQMALLPGLAAGHAVNRVVWRELLRALAPAAAFGGRLDVRPEICLAAAEAGVMTVSVKLGIGEEMLAPFAIADGAGRFAEAAFPDVVAVWGETQKAMIEKRFPACRAKIVVSGRTRNDSFAPLPGMEAGAIRAEASRPDLRAHLGADPGDAIIVYGANHMTKYGLAAGGDFGAPCMSLGGYRAFLAALTALAQARGDAVVVVKPHPSDDISAIEAVVAEIASPRCLLLTDAAGFHNVQLLEQSALFVSSASSMFSEALLAGALPVNLWTPDVNYLYETGRLDAFSPISLTAEDVDGMCAIVGRALDDPAFRRAEVARLTGGLEGVFGARDGRNALRLVEQSMAWFATGWPGRAPDAPAS